MDWLNYHHLLYFWTVAKEGTIAKAADKLMLAQPTISSQIKALEASLGEKLFERRGRRLAMTETGEMVYGYAEEIFSVGRELQNAVRQRGRDRPLRVTLGITDSLPKLVIHELLRPILDMKRPVQLTCREGKLAPMLGDLASHQLDVVLAHTRGAETLAIKTYNHKLGSSPLILMARDDLANKLKRRFPESLDQAPALLPTPNFSIRQSIERWFVERDVTPQIVAEIEDSALIKAFAGEGMGFIAVPKMIEDEVRHRYGLHLIGEAEGCVEEYFAITVERRLRHPAVVALSEAAREMLGA